MEIDKCQFPMDGWDDFVVVILGWWVVALLRLLRGDSERETVPFMEGPYAVELEITEGGILCISTMDQSKRTAESLVGSCGVLDSIAGIISQSQAVLDACRRQSWWSTDAETLESSLAELREIALQHTNLNRN